MLLPQPATLGDQDLCEVCDVRPARWRTAAPGEFFRVCRSCHAVEPCRRCDAARDRCACPEGPDVVAWVRLPVEG